MRYEEWAKLQSDEDQKIFDRLTVHNMSLKEGHNGNMLTSREFLSVDGWNNSKYHYSSIEYENYLVEHGIRSANYPLVNNSNDNRWSTFPINREL